jgi:hypothetical protein
MGKKGKKGKQAAFLVDEEALRPFECQVRDIIQTPLGVRGTVLGVRDGVLWIRWPGNIESPTPPKAKTAADLAAYGYVRRPTSAHIQRSIEERARANYEHRWYGKPAPKSAALRLPMPAASPAFAAFSENVANTAAPPKRPGTAPA